MIHGISRLQADGAVGTHGLPCTQTIALLVSETRNRLDEMFLGNS